MRTKRSVLTILLAAIATILSGLTAAPAVARSASVGAVGGGDPYFPRQGNGGYQVGHYRLHVWYTPSSHHLSGVATITARVGRRALSRFDLDLRRNLHVRSVLVDGHAARFSQPKSLVQELVITPRHALPARHAFSVRVVYGGTAKHVTDPDGSPDGFITTSDGAFVASEPQGSPTWFPVNDMPADKATYRVYVTVPKGLTAVSNGAYLGQSTAGGRTTWKWNLTKPVSSYLVTATIGKFAVRQGRTPGGVPYFIAVDPTVKAQADPVLKKLPAIVDFYTRKFGRYPFGQAGAIVDNAPFVGYALETATRPVFDRAPSIETLSHELAHQWFGDEVTVRRWRHIWLNEGFAEWGSWLWDGHRGATTPAQHLRNLMAVPASNTSEWLPPPAHPGGPKQMFAGSIYDRGAGALQALRQRVGTPTFMRILRGWLRAHAYRTATVAQFRAYAEHVSHRDLDALFFQWLDKKGKPTL
jgi:aminopeptidase N